MIEVREYDLPDAKLINAKSKNAFDFMVWQPSELAVIIGASNNAEKSLFIEKLHSDAVPVYKRLTGGEAVVISESTVIISCRLANDKKKKSTEYFAEINATIIKSLEALGVENIGTDGISDIKIGHKKILGSSMKRTQDFVFYHAVLNVSESTELMEKYLRFPSKTPDYRENRSHAEFVTSLHAENFLIPIEKLISELNSQLASVL